MKIIDAINKINKEEKFRFKLLSDGDIYNYIGGSLYNETVGERAEWIIDNKWLNKEIELIEEEKKIPEKICTNRIINTKDILEFEMIQNKINAEYTYAINSIIDYLKSKGE